MTSSTWVPIPDGQQIVNRVLIGGLVGDKSGLELKKLSDALGRNNIKLVLAHT